jgi:hypothetical protein
MALKSKTDRENQYPNLVTNKNNMHRTSNAKNDLINTNLSINNNSNIKIMKTTSIIYKTVLNTIHFDENGKITTNSQEFIFEDSNPLIAREHAILKAVALNLEYGSNPLYDSHFITEQKGYKNSNGYSLNVFFESHNSENEIFCCILGEDLEDMIDDMCSELDCLKSIGVEVISDSIEVNDYVYEVVGDNLELILQFTLS